MFLLQAVCNYRRSLKHRVKHGTVEWSKVFDNWPHSEVLFSECEVVLYYAAYINKKYFITQYSVSLYWYLDFIGYGFFPFLWKVQCHIIAHERQIYSYYWPDSTPWMGPRTGPYYYCLPIVQKIAKAFDRAMEVVNPAWNEDVYDWPQVYPGVVPKTFNW